MKKCIFALLCLLVAGTFLYAGGNQAGGGTGGATGGNSGGSTTGTGATKSLTVACLEGWYPAVSINDNLPMWQVVEKRTGIHINWQANSDYDTAMQPVIASGSKLPDIMLIPPTWGNSGVYKLGRDGLIIQLDNLINQYAPDLQKLLQDNPALKAMITAPDGKIYSVCDAPMFVNNMVVQNALFIRQDWLDKLNLQVPVTIDDWHNVLTAFKTRDPNGNGRNDEIPWAGISTVGNLNNLMALGSAFGLPVGDTEWWYDNTGKVFHVYSSPQYRNFLQTMSQWYKEGLLDIELNRDEPNFQSLTSTNVVGAFVHLAERTTQYDGFVKSGGVSSAKHTLVDPPKAPDGSNPMVLKRPPTWSHYGITRDCKDPETAMRWINFIYGSDEGVTMNEWGIEGLSFTRGPDGKPRFTDFVTNNPNGLDPYNALRSLGASNTILVRTPADVYIALNQGTAAIPFGQKMLPYRVEPFPEVMLSAEDQAVIDRVQPDIQTYCDETRVKFLTGEIPLSNWDNYVQTLKSMGLDDVQKIRQQQYNRSK